MVAKKDLPIDAICSAYEAGDSGRAIARKYGVSHETIYKRLVDSGVMLRDAASEIKLGTESDVCAAMSNFIETGLPIEHIASDFGVSSTTLRKRLLAMGAYSPSRAHEKWIDDEIEFVRDHYNVDLSSRQIADRLGRTRNEIIGKARRMGLCAPINSAATMEGNQLNKASAMRA